MGSDGHRLAFFFCQGDVILIFDQNTSLLEILNLFSMLNLFLSLHNFLRPEDLDDWVLPESKVTKSLQEVNIGIKLNARCDKIANPVIYSPMFRSF